MERAITFILEQQAHTTAKLDSLIETVGTLSHTVDKLSAKVDRTAESVTALLAIAEIHERELTELRQTQAEAQSRTDERLNALINTVARHISEGHNGKA